MGRTPLIAGNWKMYKTVEQAEDYVQALLPAVSSVDGVDVALCVPFTAIGAVADSVRGSRVEVYAQNMHQQPEGASPVRSQARCLARRGARGVVLGHSERREVFRRDGPGADGEGAGRTGRGPPHQSCVSARRRRRGTTTTPIASSASR